MLLDQRMIFSERKPVSLEPALLDIGSVYSAAWPPEHLKNK